MTYQENNWYLWHNSGHKLHALELYLSWTAEVPTKNNAVRHKIMIKANMIKEWYSASVPINVFAKFEKETRIPAVDVVPLLVAQVMVVEEVLQGRS